MRTSFFYILSAIFILVLGTYISGTVLTPFAQAMGATWLQVGILSASMYVVRLIIGTPVGVLADKKGTLKVLNYSLLLYPFIAVAYWFSGNIYGLINARLLHGVASAMMLPMGMAYVGQIAPKNEEGKYMSVYNACIMLASGIGPFIAGIIASFFNYRASFIVLFVLAVLALMISLLSPKEDKNTGETTCFSHKHKNNITLYEMIHNIRLIALGVPYIAMAVLSSLIGFYTLPFLKSRGIDLIFTGSILAVYNIVSAAALLPLGKICDKYSKYFITLISGIMTSLLLVILPFIQNVYGMFAIMLLIAIFAAALLAGASALSTILGRSLGMGKTMGLLSTLNSVGMIFGSIFLSFMPGSQNRYDWFFYFTGIIMLISVITFVFLWPARLKEGIEKYE